MLTILISGGLFFSRARVLKAAPAVLPSPATLDAAFKERETGTAVESTDKVRVEPGDLGKPAVFLRSFTPTNKNDATVAKRLFPDGTAIFDIEYTTASLPTKNFQFILRYPDYLTPLDLDGGQEKADVHQIVWDEKEVAFRTTWKKQVSFQIPAEIASDIVTLDLKGQAQSTDRPRFVATSLKIDIWGQAKGKLVARDDAFAEKEQPLVGVQVALLAGSDKLTDPDYTHVVTDQEGRYRYSFKRSAAAKKEGIAAPLLRLKVTFQTPDDDVSQPGLRLSWTNRNLDKLGIDELPNPDDVQPVTLTTVDFAIESDRVVEQDLSLTPLSGSLSYPNLAEPTNSEQQEMVRTAGAIWKNLWQALELSNNLLEREPPLWDQTSPFQAYLHRGDLTATTHKGIILAKDEWKSLPFRRYPANAELHEFMHALQFKFGLGAVRGMSPEDLLDPTQVPQGLVKVPEIDPFTTERKTYIAKSHYGWLNDFSTDAFDEGSASFGAAWFDHEINGVRNPACSWCYFDVDGQSILFRDNILTAPIAPFLPTKNRPALVDPNRPAVIRVGASHDEEAVYGFLKSVIVGAHPDLVGLKSSSKTAPPWVRQEPGGPADETLFEYGERPSAQSRLIFKNFLTWLATINPETGATSVTMEDVVSHFVNDSDTTASANPIAVAYGLFTDENCNYHYDYGETVGKVANWWGGYIQADGTRAVFGARPWREKIEVDPRQAIDLKLVDVTGQPMTTPVPVTITIDYAPPFGSWSSSHTIETTGGRTSLILPPATFRTRALITVGSAPAPSLIIDSDDYWAILDRPAAPSVVAKATVNVSQPKTVTVPAWPSNLLVPASQTPLDYIAKVADAPPETPVTSPQPPPAGQMPAARLNGTTPTVVSSSSNVTVSPSPASSTSPAVPTAGQPIALTLTGFAAPQTITIQLDGAAIDETRVLSSEAEIALLIPSATRAGNHTLTLIGEAGETVTVPLQITAAASGAQPSLSSKQDWLAVILILLGVFLALKLRRRFLGLLLLGLGLSLLGVAPSTEAQTIRTRRADFVQLIPADANLPGDTTTALWRMNDWDTFDAANNLPERMGYFGRPETICFVQRLADNWTKLQPEQILTVNDMSLLDGGAYAPHSTHRAGRSIDLWSERRALPRYQYQIRATAGQWVDSDSYDPKLADDLLFAIWKSWTEVTGKKKNSALPKVLFDPKPGFEPPQFTLPGSTRVMTVERDPDHANHWHVELPNPRGQYYVE